MFSIVFEAYTRFQSLSAATSYSVLAAILVVMTVMGLRFELLTPLFVGIGGWWWGWPWVSPRCIFHSPRPLFLGHLAAFRSSRVHGAEPLQDPPGSDDCFVLHLLGHQVGGGHSERTVRRPGAEPVRFLRWASFSSSGCTWSTTFQRPQILSSFSTFEWNLVVLNGLGASAVPCWVGPLRCDRMVGTIGLGLGLLHLVLAVVLRISKGGAVARR